MQTSWSLRTPALLSTQVSLKAAASPARPPVMGRSGPSTSTMPAIKALPFTATPWPSSSTARRPARGSCSARRRPAAWESAMPSSWVLASMARLGALPSRASKCRAVSTQLWSLTPSLEISPAVEQPIRRD